MHFFQGVSIVRIGGQDDNCRGSVWIIFHNTLSGTLYIIDNLPLFDYLYIGFEGVVTALNVCLIILQDTSELPMCLRLVAPILY